MTRDDEAIWGGGGTLPFGWAKPTSSPLPPRRAVSFAATILPGVLPLHPLGHPGNLCHALGDGYRVQTRGVIGVTRSL